MRLPINFFIPDEDRAHIRAAREGATVVVKEIDAALEELKGKMEQLRRQRRNFLIFRRCLDVNRIRDEYQLFSAIDCCCSIFCLSVIVSSVGWRKEIPAVFHGEVRDWLLTRVVELAPGWLVDADSTARHAVALAEDLEGNSRAGARGSQVGGIE